MREVQFARRIQLFLTGIERGTILGDRWRRAGYGLLCLQLDQVTLPCGRPTVPTKGNGDYVQKDPFYPPPRPSGEGGS